MAFNIDDPIGSLGFSMSGMQASMKDIAVYVIWGVILLVVGAFIWKKYQDKKIFVHPVRIFRRRTNGLVKETNTFGGYMVNNGLTVFTIKQGMFKRKELPRLPRSDLMDEEDRFYYYQLSPEAPLVQCKRTFNIETVMVTNEKYIEPNDQEKENIIKRYIAELKQDSETKNLKQDELQLLAVQRLEEQLNNERNEQIDVTSVYYSPVPTDQKLQAYYDIRKLNQTLGVDVNKQFAYFTIGIIGLVIAGIVLFYIASNKGSIPLIELGLSLLI